METTKKNHPVVSGVILVLCVISLLLSILSGMLRHTLSKNHIQSVVSDTKISELAIGDAVYTAIQISAETIDDADYSSFVKHINCNTTIAEILYKVLKAENEEIRKKNIKSALDNKQFKKQLGALIASYIDDLLYDHGDGKLDADKVEDLMEAFYDGMKLSEEDDENDRAAAWKEAFLEVDEEALEAYSVEHIAEVIPLTPLRVVVSPIFMLGMLLLGILLLAAAIVLDYRTPKDAVKKLVIVTVSGGVLIGLVLIVTRNCGEMLLRKNVEEMEFGDSLAEMVENLDELEKLEWWMAAEKERRELRQNPPSRPQVVTISPTPTAAPQTGPEFNIYCFNSELQDRMEDHYPGYTKIDSTHGQIGDMRIHFIIIPSENYQEQLENALCRNDNISDDERVDLFLMEPEYAKKFIDENKDFAIPLDDLGITDAEIADQYAYTRDLVTDQSGSVRAVAWLAQPGVMIYSRDLAKQVLGSEDPKDVQEAVKDWDAYYETAEKMAQNGYMMTATIEDNYRVYYQNLSSPWVENNKITIDPAMEEWAKGAVQMVSDGSTDYDYLWSMDWSKGFYPEKNVFCYFGPSWFYEWCMYVDDISSVAGQGGWAVTEGPQSFYWGGTWMAAARGTLYPEAAAEIMRTMTMDESVLAEIAEEEKEYVNNRTVMGNAAQNSAFEKDLLGGQNPNAILDRAGTQVDVSYATEYDTFCNDAFLSAMKPFICGQKSYDEACEDFYRTVENEYGWLSH